MTFVVPLNIRETLKLLIVSRIDTEDQRSKHNVPKKADNTPCSRHPFRYAFGFTPWVRLMAGLDETYWRRVEACKRFKLSHAQIHMARELGMNPTKFGSLASRDQEP